jgi:hypothetical protein
LFSTGKFVGIKQQKERETLVGIENEDVKNNLKWEKFNFQNYSHDGSELVKK